MKHYYYIALVLQCLSITSFASTDENRCGPLLSSEKNIFRFNISRNLKELSVQAREKLTGAIIVINGNINDYSFSEKLIEGSSNYTLKNSILQIVAPDGWGNPQVLSVPPAISESILSLIFPESNSSHPINNKNQIYDSFAFAFGLQGHDFSDRTLTNRWVESVINSFTLPESGEIVLLGYGNEYTHALVYLGYELYITILGAEKLLIVGKLDELKKITQSTHIYRSADRHLGSYYSFGEYSLWSLFGSK